jgi:hypothetical protein
MGGIKAETAKCLKDTDQMVKALEKQNQKLQAVFKNMADGLDGAIKDSNLPMIKLYRPKLEKAVEEVNNTLHTVEGCLGLIGALQQDEDFVATNFKIVENLLKKVTGIQKQLTDQLTRAREIDGRAEEAMSSEKGDKGEAIRDLAVLEDQVTDLKKTAESVEAEAPKLEAAVRKAFAAGNQKAVTDGRVKLIDLMKGGTPVLLLRSKVNTFIKNHKDLDRELKAEAQWLLDDLTRIDDIYKDLDKVVKELLELGQVVAQKQKAETESVDVAKAAKVLGVASKDEAKLAKVLEGPSGALDKNLDTLCKTLKLKVASGKEALALLKKNRIV